jgi:hypothetical protein
MYKGLWKSVENFRGFENATPDRRGQMPLACSGAPTAALLVLRACSACAGDYEDPDRTAWTPDQEEDEDRSVDGDAVEKCADDSEFPVQEA